jgi:2-polyprenyl-3-methyl-5-hydroxy-6-metoxy-1,4-benzoquinol methylase
MADSLIPENLRPGRILDVGCGSYPAFLMTTRFGERYGLDRVALPDVGHSGITLMAHDIAGISPLPFEAGYFDVVTMLAVFEHLEVAALRGLLQDIRRVIRPGGLYVMTTPVRWTEGILNAMARLKLVSREEVNEHKAQYSHSEIVAILLEAGFDRSHIKHGTFELGMNVWAVARKES